MDGETRGHRTVRRDGRNGRGVGVWGNPSVDHAGHSLPVF